jgi:hypothetical protein
VALQEDSNAKTAKTAKRSAFPSPDRGTTEFSSGAFGANSYLVSRRTGRPRSLDILAVLAVLALKILPAKP